MIKDVVIIGGGDPSSWPDLSFYHKDTTKWIGVDRGTLYGLEVGFAIEAAVGDFDSLSEDEWLWLNNQLSDIERCPAEKDDTDMQLGVLKAIESYPEASYTLIGATGGRLDHYLSNLWLPLQERFMPYFERIQILDNQNQVTYFKAGSHEIIKEADKKYLAYVCLVPVTKLSLYDAKYTLEQVDFDYPVSLSSNEFVGETSHFSFESGLMCVIQSKDK
ncbi:MULTISPECIES: thiamine diphosphokinase [Vagococcus]|uniref:Thiamine diphosphokinase n=1 Tax=Vagococcus fluvialis bH819 TaxID=1255619 RepID=A0A1X6WMU2_9ENTE|nr:MULTISPECIES: thiamine diphosphokinase [Vagococcus]SLM85634.1 Thiamin pyrophosphokinase [Vagococcus fluvialis bH819]HCM89600.1 thiamine diphosphokinase [Vagococcus sp.]